MSAVVSVHSYRGGTGKSNVSANLAALAALRGKRVAVVDTDVPSPGVHVLFGLTDKQITRTLNDYLHGQCRLADAAIDVTPATVRAAGGILWVVPASLNAAEIARILREGYEVSKLNDGFNELLDDLNLDILVIDTHPGLNEETLLSIAMSDVAVLLLRPDEQDFLGTAVTVEVARKLGVPNLLLVLNKVLASTDPDALRHDVERAFRADVGAVLPQNDELMRLGSRGLMGLTLPHHPWSKQVAGLADRLVALTTEVP